MRGLPPHRPPPRRTRGAHDQSGDAREGSQAHDKRRGVAQRGAERLLGAPEALVEAGEPLNHRVPAAVALRSNVGFWASEGGRGGVVHHDLGRGADVPLRQRHRCGRAVLAASAGVLAAPDSLPGAPDLLPILEAPLAVIDHILRRRRSWRCTFWASHLLVLAAPLPVRCGPSVPQKGEAVILQHLRVLRRIRHRGRRRRRGLVLWPRRRRHEGLDGGAGDGASAAGAELRAAALLGAAAEDLLLGAPHGHPIGVPEAAVVHRRRRRRERTASLAVVAAAPSALVDLPLHPLGIVPGAVVKLGGSSGGGLEGRGALPNLRRRRRWGRRGCRRRQVHHGHGPSELLVVVAGEARPELQGRAAVRRVASHIQAHVGLACPVDLPVVRRVAEALGGVAREALGELDVAAVAGDLVEDVDASVPLGGQSDLAVSQRLEHLRGAGSGLRLAIVDDDGGPLPSALHRDALLGVVLPRDRAPALLQRQIHRGRRRRRR
mmetsp:Transcript_65191/g.212385  ORF Transcript_65191/g.212385 Transcript_65191/m.212385 type:complete len:491 (-) Transcript_65191:1151-2623(-)